MSIGCHSLWGVTNHIDSLRRSKRLAASISRFSAPHGVNQIALAIDGPRDPRIAQRGCCRAKSDLRSERCSKPDAQPARDSRNRRTERKKGGREQEWRTRQEKRRRGSTRRSKLLREEGTDQLSRRA